MFGVKATLRCLLCRHETVRRVGKIAKARLGSRPTARRRQNPRQRGFARTKPDGRERTVQTRAFPHDVHGPIPTVPAMLRGEQKRRRSSKRESRGSRRFGRVKKLVGKPRFELGTPCAPCKCAIRLQRRVPPWLLYVGSVVHIARASTGAIRGETAGGTCVWVARLHGTPTLRD